LDDPRDALKDTIRIEILDYQGNLVDAETLDSMRTRLKGDQLAFAQALDYFQVGDDPRVPLITHCVVCACVGVGRIIYHLWFAFWYCVAFAIPILLLLVAYAWIVVSFVDIEIRDSVNENVNITLKPFRYSA
jgi:hypothetical protein